MERRVNIQIRIKREKMEDVRSIQTPYEGKFEMSEVCVGE